MTDFMVQNSCGTIGTLTSADKGSMGNRIDAVAAQFKNNFSTAVKDTVVLTSATAAGYAIVKSPKIASVAAKGLDLTAKLFKPLTEPIKNSLCKLPKPALKGLGFVALIAIPVLTYLQRSHDYKAGQIDQKYTDKAAFQKTL